MMRNLGWAVLGAAVLYMMWPRSCSTCAQAEAIDGIADEPSTSERLAAALDIDAGLGEAADAVADAAARIAQLTPGDLFAAAAYEEVVSERGGGCGCH